MQYISRLGKIEAKRLLAVAILTGSFFFSVSSVHALNFTSDSLVGTTFFFSDGDRSASADFSFSGDFLTLTLSNTFSGDTLDPIHILQAVFFDINGGVGLTAQSAMLASGSVVHYGPDGGGNVGGEFAYSGSLSGAPNGAAQGISATGYDLFSKFDNFPGSNLQDPEQVDGMNYGLLSDGYAWGGNPAVTGNFPLIQNSVIFTLSGASGLTIQDIDNVSFEYGTDLASVPEPSSILLMGMGFIGLALLRRRAWI